MGRKAWAAWVPGIVLGSKPCNVGCALSPPRGTGLATAQAKHLRLINDDDGGGSGRLGWLLWAGLPTLAPFIQGVI